MTPQNNKGFLETLASLDNVHLSDYRSNFEPSLKWFKGKPPKYIEGLYTSQEFLDLVQTHEDYYLIEGIAFTDGKYSIIYQVLGKYDNKPNFNPADYVNLETNSIDFSDLKSSDFFEYYMNEIMSYVLEKHGYIDDAKYEFYKEKAKQDSTLRKAKRENIITD